MLPQTLLGNDLLFAFFLIMLDLRFHFYSFFFFFFGSRDVYEFAFSLSSIYHVIMRDLNR